ncbi:TRAP transporter large permease [Marinisporobacter balticus]|uniref:Tripartite ATP-independent transporter DctM subunit n=1 Tax=Marinisporobacter balticus TaxID=2018667 RepID=A0A4R2KM91_9FIRM|nr:TRAP transporter large permease [Marinisporobacter balticus]TCO74544.1 tripartite ATP-independent transporter DctM subunit [Marinisporobacter balticus]
MEAIYLFMLFILFTGVGVPICYSLGISSILYLVFTNPSFLMMLPQRIWAGTNIYVMIALPLFILAGELMNRGGITQRIINFSLYAVKPIKGGLGEVNIFASMIFGGISGSSVADTSAIGSVLIPQMIKKGYSKGFATGVTVASSTMGMIIPPSVPMLTYSMISGASVGGLFLAGLIPGALIGISQIIISMYISKKRSYLLDIEEEVKGKKLFHVAKEGVLALIMPVLIVVSISFGIATASESAGIAVFYAFIVGFFVYKEIKLADLPQILRKTTLSSSSVMIVIGFSMIFSWVLAMIKFPYMVAGFFTGLDVNVFWILLLLDLFILFIGMFVDVTPALLLVTPILLPVMQALGVNPLQFGSILIVGLAIGLVTPPLGMCLNACTKICDISIIDIFKNALPFLICNIVILLLVTFVPEISLWLPRLAGLM